MISQWQMKGKKKDDRSSNNILRLSHFRVLTLRGGC